MMKRWLSWILACLLCTVYVSWAQLPGGMSAHNYNEAAAIEREAMLLAGRAVDADAGEAVRLYKQACDEYDLLQDDFPNYKKTDVLIARGKCHKAMRNLQAQMRNQRLRELDREEAGHPAPMPSPQTVVTKIPDPVHPPVNPSAMIDVPRPQPQAPVPSIYQQEELASLKRKLASREKELQKLDQTRVRLKELTRANEDMALDINDLRRRCAAMAETSANKNNTIKSLELQIRDARQNSRKREVLLQLRQEHVDELSLELRKKRLEFNELVDVDKKAVTLARQLAEMNKQLTDARETIAKLKTEMPAEDLLRRLENADKALEVERERSNRQTVQIKEQAKTLEQMRENAALPTEPDPDMVAKVAEQESLLAGRSVEIEALQSQLAAMQEKLQAGDSSLADEQGRIEQLNAELIAKDIALKDATAAQQQLKTQLANLNVSVHSSSSGVEKMKATVAKWREEAIHKDQQLNASREKMKQMRNLLDAVNGTLARRERELEVERTSVASLKNERNASQTAATAAQENAGSKAQAALDLTEAALRKATNENGAKQIEIAELQKAVRTMEQTRSNELTYKSRLEADLSEKAADLIATRDAEKALREELKELKSQDSGMAEERAAAKQLQAEADAALVALKAELTEVSAARDRAEARMNEMAKDDAAAELIKMTRLTEEQGTELKLLKERLVELESLLRAN